MKLLRQPLVAPICALRRRVRRGMPGERRVQRRILGIDGIAEYLDGLEVAEMQILQLGPMSRRIRSAWTSDDWVDLCDIGFVKIEGPPRWLV